MEGRKSAMACRRGKAGARKFVGYLYYRLHNPDCAIRRSLYVQDSARACRRSIVDWRGTDAHWDWVGRVGRRSRKRDRPLLQFTGEDCYLGDGDLWLRRVRAAGLGAALSARLSFELSEDRH